MRLKNFLIFSTLEHSRNEQESVFKIKKKERRNQPILDREKQENPTTAYCDSGSELFIRSVYSP